jgi:hypothetical protein
LAIYGVAAASFADLAAHPFVEASADPGRSTPETPLKEHLCAEDARLPPFLLAFRTEALDVLHRVVSMPSKIGSDVF